MRWSPAIAAAAVATLAAVAAAAQVSERPQAKPRPCGTRIEGSRPSSDRVDPRSVLVGPIELAGALRRVRSARGLERIGDRDGGYETKAPLSVPAGGEVTLAIAPRQRAKAELTYVRADRLRRFLDTDAVRFRACERDEPAFSYDGPVGGRTWFNGSIHVDRPICLRLQAWVPGQARPYLATVPFGKGDRCGTQEAGCDRAVGRFGRREVAVGTVAAVRAVNVYADPATAEGFRHPDTGGYGFKAPLAVPRGKVVTISIARADRDWASLGIDGRSPVDSVRLSACSRPAPRWVDPYERDWSSWVNGFTVKRLGCLRLVAREHGSPQVHRATLSFGMGADCAAG